MTPHKEQADFAAKLLQIEEQANSALQELPAGLAIRGPVRNISFGQDDRGCKMS